MSAHRQHYTPPPAQLRRDAQAAGAGLGLCVLAMAAMGILVAISDSTQSTQATPVAALRVDAKLLEQMELAERRTLHENLRTWRAGYEAAIQNGCQLQPVLAAPIGSRR